jgi:hypothetical protein
LLPVSKKRILFFLLQFILLFSFISCSLFTRNENADFYRSNPVALFYTLVQRSLEVKTFEGSGHLTVESPVEGFQGNAKVYFRQPDSLLVIIQAGFGVPVGSMLIIGDNVQLYNIRDKILFKSEGADVPLDDLIGMNLRASNLIEAALGLPRPPKFNIANNDSLQIKPVDDKFNYVVNSDIEEKRYLADPGKQVFESYSLIRPAENDTTICTFKQFRKFKNIRIPQHIQIAKYDKKERLSLYYTRMQINKKIPKNRFQLKISDNVDVVNLTKSANE